MMITDKARNITNIRRILMSQYELIVPCHFGMESVLKNEIYDIGYEITEVSEGPYSCPDTGTRNRSRFLLCRQNIS